MLKRLVRIISVVLCVCIVLGVGLALIIKEGRRIVRTPRVDSGIYLSQGKIYFRSLNPEKKLYYIYDTENKKLKKTTTKPYLPLDNSSNLNEEGDYYLTEKYKYTYCDKYLLRTDLLTGEAKPIKIFIEPNRYIEKYSFGSCRFDGENLYFQAAVSGEAYLCKCDENGYCAAIEKANGFKLHNGNIYFINTEVTSKKYSKSGEVLKQTTNNRLMVYDTKNNTVKELIDYEDSAFDYFFVSDYGILIINAEFDNHVFKIYSLNGQLIREEIFPYYVSYYFKNKGDLYARANNSNGREMLIKFSDDYSSYEVLCDDLVDSRFRFIKSAGATGFIFTDSEIYFLVTPGIVGEDSLAFCRINEDGEVEILVKERRHFLRNFFRMQLK